MNDTSRVDAVAFPGDGGEKHQWVKYEFACELLVEVQRAEAKLSERKTVHEWLNALGVPVEEGENSLCLLRRLRIACDALGALLNTQNAAEDLNSIVDGAFNVRWSYNGVRLTDTPQWVQFYVALAKSRRQVTVNFTPIIPGTSR